jgi:hypothetical protein
MSDFLWLPMRYPWRWALTLCAAISALAHIPVVGEHLAEAPYMGEEFLVLIVGCTLIGVAALICDSAALYLLAVITCGLAIAGYAATRIVAFPRLADDVGNWFEPLGVVSIIAESATVAIALCALAPRRRGSGIAAVANQTRWRITERRSTSTSLTSGPKPA